MQESTRDYVCTFIDNWLKDNYVTNLKLSEYLGVTDVSVRRWRGHLCAPDINLMEKICKYMNTTINELMGIPNDEFSIAQIKVARKYKNDEKFHSLVDTYCSDKGLAYCLDYIVDIKTDGKRR